MTTKSLHRPNSTWAFTHYCHRLNLSWWEGTDVKGSLIWSFSTQCWKLFPGTFLSAIDSVYTAEKNDRGHQRSVCVLTVSKQKPFFPEHLWHNLSPNHLRYYSAIQKLKEDYQCSCLCTDQPPSVRGRECHRDLRSLCYCYVSHQESKEKEMDLPSYWNACGSGRQG